jgi:hypothetical protein
MARWVDHDELKGWLEETLAARLRRHTEAVANGDSTTVDVCRGWAQALTAVLCAFTDGDPVTLKADVTELLDEAADGER